MTDRTNQPINVNAETKEQADQFINTIGEMFETVEMLAGADRPMNEGEWLILANQFKKLVEMRGRTRTTVIYMEAERTHIRGRVVAGAKPQTKADKLKSDKYMLCPTCKKVMTKRHYAEKHKKAGVCSHIQAVGNVVSHNKAVIKSDGERVRISDKIMLVEERSLDITHRRGVKKVDYKTKEVKCPSIAHRSLILAELWKPLECDDDGIVNVDVEVLGDDRTIERRETMTFKQFEKKDIGKYKRNAEGKWEEEQKKIRIVRPKIKIGKKKLVAVEELPEREQTTRC